MVVRNLILVLFTTSHQIKEVTLEKPVSNTLVVAACLPPAQGAELKWGVLAPVGKITKSGFLLMLLNLPHQVMRSSSSEANTSPRVVIEAFAACTLTHRGLTPSPGWHCLTRIFI